MMDDITIDVIRGCEGDCLSVDGTRVAGPKAWGGGMVIATFQVDRIGFLKMLSEIPTRKV